LALVTAVTLKGWALSRLGEFDAALPVAERAVALSNESGRPLAKLVAMNLLAYLYDDVGRYQDGSVYHQGALAMARQNGDRPWESVLLNNLAESYKMMGNFEGALKVFEDAYELAGLIGYRHIENLVLVNTGDAHLELGNIVEAENCLRQVLEEVGDKPPFFLAFCYALLGRACAAQGNVKEGLSFAQKGLKLAEEMENPEDMAAAWHALAEVAIHSKEQAVIIGRRPYSPSACFGESAHYYEENGQEVERARLLVKWGEYELTAGAISKASALLQEAEGVFSRFDLPLFLTQLQQAKIGIDRSAPI
jgi:tetratricopeptide (TPR) repeat protein